MATHQEELALELARAIPAVAAASVARDQALTAQARRDPAPAECTYWLTAQEQCGRAPISADYFELSAIDGERRIASLCRRHDAAAAQREAQVRGYSRRSR